MRNTDMESFILTPKDMNALLREFSVMYRPEDLEELQMDIGKHVDASRIPTQQRSMKGAMDAELSLHSGKGPQALKKHVIDSRDLMLQVLKARPRWTSCHPYLCKRMLKAMQLAGSNLAGGMGMNAGVGTSDGAGLTHYDTLQNYDTTGAGTAAGTTFSSTSGGKRAGGPRGIETAVARRVLSRLRAFAGRSAVSLGAMDRETKERDADTLMVERDIFKHLTGVTGLPLTDEDVLILADATDFLPEASRVRCDVILEALFGASSHSSGRGGRGRVEEYDEDGVLIDEFGGDDVYMPGASGRNKGELTEACVFALDHLKDLLWKHAARLHRSTLEWIADVRTVFKGFDKSKTGFISSEDFSIALNLLNATVSPDILQDISYVPEGPGLIDYNEILEYVLVPPTKAKPSGETTTSTAAATGVRKGSGSNGTGVASKTAADGGEGGDKETLKLKVQRKVAQKESPVQILLNVVRKSLHHFIVSDHSLEQAWVCLLKVFQRFDPQETNQVNPRDFCLAVSVLLDGDDVVLTKSEWAEIIDHFASLGSESRDQKRRQVDFLGGALVDYMLFCETVLDPNEIKSRLYEIRANDRQPGLDRTKQQFLSKTNPSMSNHQDAHSPTHTQRGGSSSSGFKGHVIGSAYTGATTKELMASMASTMQSTTGNMSDSAHRQQLAATGTKGGRPQSAGSKHQQQQQQHAMGGSRGLHIDKEDDQILKRFQQASAAQVQQAKQRTPLGLASKKASGGGALGYNNAGAAAASYENAFDRFDPNNANVARSSENAKKSEWNTDNLYRVARTQGQASRETARGSAGNVNLRATGGQQLQKPQQQPHYATTGGMQSSKQSYSSSHTNKGSSGKSRFNWDD